MTTGAATVRPDAPLSEAARIMIEHRISGLPVVEAGGKLVGIVTEGDFLPTDAGERSSPLDVLLAGKTAGNDFNNRKVAEIMSRDPITIGVAGGLEEAVERMRQYKIKRLPVVADGRVVGILSRADILGALLRRAHTESGN